MILVECLLIDDGICSSGIIAGFFSRNQFFGRGLEAHKMEESQETNNNMVGAPLLSWQV